MDGWMDRTADACMSKCSMRMHAPLSLGTYGVVHTPICACMCDIRQPGLC